MSELDEAVRRACGLFADGRYRAALDETRALLEDAHSAPPLKIDDVIDWIEHFEQLLRCALAASHRVVTDELSAGDHDLPPQRAVRHQLLNVTNDLHRLLERGYAVVAARVAS